MRDKQFSYEEKVDIVREHEEAHKTIKAICEEYDISKSYLCYLLKEYREKGRKAFKDTKSHTAAQKLEIIKRHYEDGITIAELVRETGIPYGTLKQWMTFYQQRGAEGISDRKRGRPLRPHPDTPEEKIKRLEMENEVLRSFLEECERWDAKNLGSK